MEEVPLQTSSTLYSQIAPWFGYPASPHTGTELPLTVKKWLPRTVSLYRDNMWRKMFFQHANLPIIIPFANKLSYVARLNVFLSYVQVLIGTDSITNLHKLEQVSSDEGIGTLAENLLEALREHSDVNLKIEAARRETRAEKKRMAMAMRQKALGTLGMTVLYSLLSILFIYISDTFALFQCHSRVCYVLF